MVWISHVKIDKEPRLGLNECPVSYVSGESHALVDEFLAHIALGMSIDIGTWSARRVDAFLVLNREWRQIEK